MKCIVTAGPTYEELDEVRRLTNMSTGELGSGLADFLSNHGHEVELLIGHYATTRLEAKVQRRQVFTTTQDLQERLRALGSKDACAIFHAAAVSDFGFGKIWSRGADGELREIKSAKIPTRNETLLAELTPTPKIIHQLRDWYPKGMIVGWKYEVVGDRVEALSKGGRKIEESRSDACVVNGRAYGEGFGLITRTAPLQHLIDKEALFGALERQLAAR